MKIGFIGAGSMGSLLVGAFVRSGAMRPDDIVVSSRTPSKLSALAEQYPGLHIAASNREAAIGADYLFLCVKPLDFRRVLEEIAPVPRRLAGYVCPRELGRHQRDLQIE